MFVHKLMKWESIEIRSSKESSTFYSFDFQSVEMVFDYVLEDYQNDKKG